MTVVTEEMRTAMRVLAKSGVEFYRTREKELDCGCLIYEGWVTAKLEPGIRVIGCDPEHAAAAQRAIARWDDPDVAERFLDVNSADAMAALIGEEIAHDVC